MAERVEIAREVFKDHANVEVDTFDGLLVDYVGGGRPASSCAGCAPSRTSSSKCRWR